MQKKIFFIIIIFNMFCNVYGQSFFKDNFDAKFIIGNIGGGMNVFEDDYNFEISAGLVNFFIEHSKTNLGFGISPLKYVGNYSVKNEKWTDDLYFLNASLYWNPFNKKNILFGPFVSMNYLCIDNVSKFTTKEYVFSSGLMFILRTYIADGRYPFQIIGAEAGYRNISGRNGFYFNVSTDISILAGLIIAGIQGMGSGVIEANEAYEKSGIPGEPKR